MHASTTATSHALSARTDSLIPQSQQEGLSSYDSCTSTGHTSIYTAGVSSAHGAHIRQDKMASAASHHLDGGAGLGSYAVPHASNSSEQSLGNKHQGSNPNLVAGTSTARDMGKSSKEAQAEGQAGSAAHGARGGLPNYSFGFWSPELAAMRKEYLINMARLVLLISVLIWGVVTIYWGSLWKANDLSYKLHGWVINRDTGAIGNNITNAFMSSNLRATPRLTWTSIDPSLYPTMAEIEQALAVEEKAWVLVEIINDATARLDAARANPTTANFPTSSVINVYYSEARNQQSVNGIVLGVTRGVLTGVLPTIERNSLAQYLSQTTDLAALTTLGTTAPQLLSNPLGVSYINFRPWDLPVAIAPTFVGLIYVMILAFNVTMGNFGMRQGIQRKLRLRSLVMMRIFVPMVAYVVISIMFSLINVPFDLTFGRMGYGYGAGFMIWLCFTYLGMCVLGLVTETAISLVGQRFIGFFLVFFIIINVACANLPIELQVSFFQYGYAIPFYQLRQAYITIVFNAGRHIDLLKYMGILLAWLAVIFLTFPIWIWLERRSERKQAANSLGPAGGPTNEKPPVAVGADAA